MWKRKKPLDNLQGLKLFFVAANEGRTGPPPKPVKLFIAYKCLFCQEKYFFAFGLTDFYKMCYCVSNEELRRGESTEN
nr:MAG TPA: putative lipoprotein [Caudoviricetes sp.]